MTVTAPTRLDFYFDAQCPYAWRTALWLREVRRERPVEVTWRQFSLALVNQDEPDSSLARKGDLLGRLFIAAERLGGNDAVERLYLAVGDAIHGRGLNPLNAGVVEDALSAAGLPTELRDTALADATTARDYRASHEAGVAKGGFGVPTLVFEGSDSGCYGPVVDPVPIGQAALALWDFTTWAARQPYLWELKRNRQGRKPLPQPADMGSHAEPPLPERRAEG